MYVELDSMLEYGKTISVSGEFATLVNHCHTIDKTRKMNLKIISRTLFHIERVGVFI